MSRLRICTEARKSVPGGRGQLEGSAASARHNISGQAAGRRRQGQEDRAWGGSHAPPRPPLPGRRPRPGPVGDPEQSEALPPKPAPAPGPRWTREGAPLPQDFRIPFCPRDRRKGCGPARAPRVVSGRRPCPPAPGRKLLRCPPVPLTPQSGGAGQRASRPIFQQRRQQPEEARGRVPPTRRGASVLGRGRRRGGVLTAAFPNSSSAVVARRRLPGTSASTAISPSLSPRFPRFLLPLLPPAPCRPAPARRPRALRHGVTPTGPTAGGSRGGRRLTHVGSAPARCTGVVPTAAPTPLPGSGDFALSAPGAGDSPAGSAGPGREAPGCCSSRRGTVTPLNAT
ncbi:uncharacterized protein LOC120362166 [Saimiri boliviensis]|uniref:uncharacterized protein LOC120362166 n=1 Tax=Saimiri boliviensis TaxID=27679 RepID=UPI003D77429F